MKIRPDFFYSLRVLPALLLAMNAFATGFKTEADNRKAWTQTLIGALRDQGDQVLGRFQPDSDFVFTAKVKSSLNEIPIPFKFYKQQDSRRPWFVLLVGIFGTEEAPVYQGIGKLLWDRGYSVLIVPNTWSKVAVNGGLSFIPGDLPYEAQATAEWISDFFAQRKFNPSHLNLMGVSYGGLLLSRVRENLDRMNLGSQGGVNVVLGPPANLPYALNELDQLKVRAKTENNCNKWNWGWDFVSNVFTAGESDDLYRCVFTVLSRYSFFPSLNYVAQKLGYRKSFNGSFVDYLQEYLGVCSADRCGLPETLQDEFGRLNFDRHPTLLTTTFNDPLNPSGFWFDFQNKFPDADYLFYKEGGHVEYYRFENFKQSFAEWLKVKDRSVR